jgi:hypothetical protein
MRLVRLRQAGKTDSDIYVNPDRVQYVCWQQDISGVMAGTGRTAVVIGDDLFSIAGTMDEVVQQLDGSEAPALAFAIREALDALDGDGKFCASDARAILRRALGKADI